MGEKLRIPSFMLATVTFCTELGTLVNVKHVRQQIC